MRKLGVNLAGWGVTLGGLLGCASTLFIWIEVVDASGSSERYRAISTVTGQTLFFASILAGIAGLGILVSVSGWRFVFSALALLGGGLLAAAAGWAIIDPAGFTKYAADAQAFASMTTSSGVRDASAALSQAFASGQLDANVRIGAIVGLIGGLLALLGAFLSFGRRAAPIE